MQTTCFSFTGSAERREELRAGPETAAIQEQAGMIGVFSCLPVTRRLIYNQLQPEPDQAYEIISICSANRQGDQIH